MTTFNTLVTKIANELERENDANTIASIPNFINDAQERICRDCVTIGFEQYVTGFFIQGNPVIPKPGRWRRTISMNYGTQDGNYVNPLILMTREFLLSYWPNQILTAPPKYYSDLGFYNISVAPVPDMAYPFQMSYLELPPPLNAEVQTNWLTNYAPDLLFYGALLEAAPYLKNFQDYQTWESAYIARVGSINGQDASRKTDRSSNVSAD